MTALPTDPAAVFIGTCLRDPGEGPWGGGTRAPYHGPPFPPRPCPDCGGAEWIAFDDPFIGGTLDARCPTCSGAA